MYYIDYGPHRIRITADNQAAPCPFTMQWYVIPPCGKEPYEPCGFAPCCLAARGDIPRQDG